MRRSGARAWRRHRSQLHPQGRSKKITQRARSATVELRMLTDPGKQRLFRPDEIVNASTASRRRGEPIDHRELTNCFSASRRMPADSSGSVTIRDIVTAPIIVAAATNARRLATSGRVLPDSAAMMFTSSRKACVAAARVFSSHRAISLPSAANGQPAEGSSL